MTYFLAIGVLALLTCIVGAAYFQGGVDALDKLPHFVASTREYKESRTDLYVHLSDRCIAFWCILVGVLLLLILVIPLGGSNAT